MPLPTCAALVLAVALLGAGCSQTTSVRAESPARDRVAANAVVAHEVDGDTLRIRVDQTGTVERVRLIGIDTPETKDPRRPVQCFGHEASAHMAGVLPPGTRVRLVRDVEERDRYGRLLAYVYRARDGLFVNLAMATGGYAYQLTFPPNVAHVDEFTAAVRRARDLHRGLWTACAGVDERVPP